MKIQNFNVEKKNGLKKVKAVVTWEENDLPQREIYFGTTNEFADDLLINPNSFLLATFLPAMFLGEKRIQIKGSICPKLLEGIYTNMQWYSFWYGSSFRPVEIEAEKEVSKKCTNKKTNSALFLSGGVDSLFTLRNNRLSFKHDHPCFIKDCFIVHGFDMYHDENTEKKYKVFERNFATLEKVALDAKINLIPVYTNVRHLYSNTKFWIYWFFGAALSSVAHVFSERIHTVSISSGPFLRELEPHGSHPLIEPNYSSSDLNILHAGLRFTRLDKIRVLADWTTALQVLRVCIHNQEDKLNCGKCEKCIRTMCSLLALEKLKDASAFVENDVSSDLLMTVDLERRDQVPFYKELVPPLNEIGRTDLTEVINYKLKEYSKFVKWKEEEGIKGSIKKFDRKYFNGCLSRICQSSRKLIKG